MGLSKNKTEALSQVKDLHSKLVELRSKHALTEVHSADIDFGTRIMDDLYGAEKSCMVLITRLVEQRETI